MQNVTAVPAAASLAPSPSKALHISLWVTQALLAALFLMAGGTKVSAPLESLQGQMPWVTGSLGGLVRAIGVVELLGAVGVVLPSLTRVQPRLTPAAALGLATVMVLAAITHVMRGEGAMIGANIVFAAMALFVAWGRTSKAPIAPR